MGTGSGGLYRSRFSRDKWGGIVIFPPGPSVWVLWPVGARRIASQRR